MNIDEILFKYRGFNELYARNWQSVEVRDTVLSLALIVRLYSFGYGKPAVSGALLLHQSEPLESLTCDDPAVAKIKALTMAVNSRH